MIALLFNLLLLSLVLRLTVSNEEEWLVKIKTATKAGATVLNQKLSDEQDGTLLIVAAREGYYSAVEQLLKVSSVDKDVQDVKGHSALMAAIVSSYTSSSLIATAIIKAQCNVNLLDVEGKDALMLSAAKGLLSVVELLLVHKAIATNTDQDGWTCLHHAAANNQATVVEALLRNPDVTHNTRAKNGQTALHLCASRGHVAVCSVLLQHSNSSVDRHDANGYTPLLLAIQAQQIDMVAVLLKGHAHVNVVSRRHDEAHGESPLMAALRLPSTTPPNRNIRLAMVQMLLSAGPPKVHVNYRQHQRNPLLSSSTTPKGTGQHGLGQQGIGSRNFGSNHTVTALCIAAAIGDVECVRALLRAGANPSIPCFEHAFLITGSSSSSSSSSTSFNEPGNSGSGGNDKMLTPREFAQKGKHQMVVVALLEHQQQHKLPLIRLQPPPRPQKKKPPS